MKYEKKKPIINQNQLGCRLKLFTMIRPNLSKQGTAKINRDEPNFSQNQLGYNIAYVYQHAITKNAMELERKTKITGIN